MWWMAVALLVAGGAACALAVAGHDGYRGNPFDPRYKATRAVCQRVFLGGAAAVALALVVFAVIIAW